MKRVLASLLFLATAVQAVAPAPQNSAASQPERLVSVAQSPYDFRFHIEQGEWDQVDATLRRLPTNYQFDAYKGNTPVMMAIDLFAQKMADKPKSIWQTAVGGAVKACSGAALVVVGLALAFRAKNNVNAAKPEAPKPSGVRFGVVEDVDDASVSDDEAEEKEVGSEPRVRLKHPPHEDQTEAIRQKMDADKKADQHRAQAERGDLDAMKKGADGSWMPYAKQIHSLTEQAHNVRYHDLKPVLATVEEAAMDLKNRAGAIAVSAHETIEDVRDAMHEGRQVMRDAVRHANKDFKKLSKEARKTLKQTAREAKKIRQAATQGIEAVSNDLREGVDILREQGNKAWSLGTALGQGIGAVGCFLTGLWVGWKSSKNIKSLIGLPQRTHDLNKFRSIITELLHRKDVNLGIQNQDGETALQMVRRYMAENMNDRENYQLLSELEQLIIIRAA